MGRYLVYVDCDVGLPEEQAEEAVRILFDSMIVKSRPPFKVTSYRFARRD